MKRFRLKLLLFCALALLFGGAQAMLGVTFACPNDDCTNATPVGNVTDLAFDTTDATFDGPSHCMDSPNIWYCYTATCTGIATVSLCGSDYDTMLAVYQGCGCNPAAIDQIRCNDDYDPPTYRYSQISFGVIAGNKYLIEIGGFEDKTGQGVMNITCEPAFCPPANDDCTNAQPIGDVWHQPFDIRCATFDGPGDCMDGANIWYRYTAPCTGIVTVSTCGSEFDTVIAVYSGFDCTLTGYTLIACNDDYPGCDLQSQLTFEAIEGHQYLIEVGGFDDATDRGVLTIMCEGVVPPPPPPPPPVFNDDCSKARPVGNVTNLPFDTSEATYDGPACSTAPNLWYCYTATCTGDVTVSLCGSSYDTKLAVYKGCYCYPTPADLIECNDDYCGQQSQITFTAVAGNQYLIEVGGYSNKTGQGVLTISCEGETPPPTELNDDCSKARPVGDVTNLPFDTSEATFDGSGLCMTSPNLWYCYTATCTGDVTVSLCGSSYDTKLAVYKGFYCYLTPGDLIECNDDYCGRQSQLTFAAIAGNQYLIEVGGYQDKTGHGVLSISCEGKEAPANLDFGDAPDSTNNFGSAMTAYIWGLYKTTQANFPTIFNDGSTTGPFGPFHRRPLEVAHLGQNVSLEVEADIGPDQDGVNNIHPPTDSANKDGADDGVILPLSLPNCGWATVDYLVKVIKPGTDLYVNIWLDWNRDGDWDDDSSTDQTFDCGKASVSEWAVENQLLFNLPAGINQITTPAFMAWHPQYGSTKIWMRITLSEQPWKGGETPGKLGNGGSGPQAGYDFGETEDYLVTPIISETECTLCEDLNGDGKIDSQDLVILVNKWLQQCM